MKNNERPRVKREICSCCSANRVDILFDKGMFDVSLENIDGSASALAHSLLPVKHEVCEAIADDIDHLNVLVPDFKLAITFEVEMLLDAVSRAMDRLVTDNCQECGHSHTRAEMREQYRLITEKASLDKDKQKHERELARESMMRFIGDQVLASIIQVGPCVGCGRESWPSVRHHMGRPSRSKTLCPACELVYVRKLALERQQRRRSKVKRSGVTRK